MQERTLQSIMEEDNFDPNLKPLRELKVQIVYNGKLCVGHLWFAGINPLHGQYQVTLNRTAYWPVDPSSIKICEPKMRIHEK